MQIYFNLDKDNDHIIHVEVKGAEIVDGILSIELTRNIPEKEKPKTIKIKTLDKPPLISDIERDSLTVIRHKFIKNRCFSPPYNVFRWF